VQRPLVASRGNPDVTTVAVDALEHMGAVLERTATGRSETEDLRTGCKAYGCEEKKCSVFHRDVHA
jgi:hypothetical protein